MKKLIAVLILFMGTAYSQVGTIPTTAGGGGGGTEATAAESQTATGSTQMMTPRRTADAIASGGGCGVVRTSATVLTVFPGSSATHPCVFEFGGVRRAFSSPATVTLAASSVITNASVAWIYLKSDGVLYVGLAAAFTSANVTCSGCTKETSITAVPTGAKGIYSWPAGTTDDQWDSSGETILLALMSKNNVSCGTDLTCTVDSNGDTSIDKASTVPTKSEVQNGTLLACTGASGSDAYTCTMSPTLASYTNNMRVTFIPDVSNTGAAQLNINSVGNFEIKKCDATTAPANNDLVANIPVVLTHHTPTTPDVWLLPCNPATVSAASVATDTIWAAKGDLVAATGNDAASVVTVGANGKILLADSGQTNGLLWSDRSASGTFASIPTCNAAATGLVYIFTDSLYSQARCDGSAWAYFADGKSWTRANGWTQDTGGASCVAGTVTETYGQTTIQPNSTTNDRYAVRYRSAALSSSFSITFLVRYALDYSASTNYPGVHIGLRQSTGANAGRKLVFGYEKRSTISGTPQMIIGGQLNADCTISSYATTVSWVGAEMGQIYLNIRDDGATNYEFRASHDGFTWQTLGTIGRTAWVDVGESPQPFIAVKSGTSATRMAIGTFLGYY